METVPYPPASLQAYLNAAIDRLRFILQWHSDGAGLSFADYGGAASEQYTEFECIADVVENLTSISRLMVARIPADTED